MPPFHRIHYKLREHWFDSLVSSLLVYNSMVLVVGFNINLIIKICIFAYPKAFGWLGTEKSFISSFLQIKRCYLSQLKNLPYNTSWWWFSPWAKTKHLILNKFIIVLIGWQVVPFYLLTDWGQGSTKVSL